MAVAEVKKPVPGLIVFPSSGERRTLNLNPKPLDRSLGLLFQCHILVVAARFTVATARSPRLTVACIMSRAFVATLVTFFALATSRSRW